ncbi:galactosyltransferase-related protein [Rhodococcus oxybenzonivorans]|uniref:glycosyltransferase family 2 protein n=1 Tax=Rhodococcus oxybenzonivorans TaxID=1990687 RepID=UPI002954FAEA|nr:galactosyltransferase-related protein [Rhodococcus oxybenzonivorans]MDV7351704.1 galactosyltransferase-related protein [Rhodococcus oxybenzonivorans]
MKTAVVTIAARREHHLRQHLRSVGQMTERVGDHVVVAIGDRRTTEVVSEVGGARSVWCEHDGGPLPLAAARNLGADAALAAGADLIVFLDVDCLAGPALLRRYRVAADHPRNHSTLLCGPVTYLPPPGPGGYDLDRLAELRNPHPARPAPEDGTVLTGTDFTLFWSLSFAVSRETWHRIGGFCTEYRGYGGEDTDFACSAAEAGIGLRWVGGADAFHQHHPVSDPPVEHLGDILANAHLFHRRWGWWPMRGWLEAFEALGLIDYDAAKLRWVPR